MLTLDHCPNILVEIATSIVLFHEHQTIWPITTDVIINRYFIFMKIFKYLYFSRYTNLKKKLRV